MSDEKGKDVSCESCGDKIHTGIVKDSWLWVRDTKGHGSVTVTFATVAFWVTTLAYIMSIFESIGPIPIRPFDVAACSSYMVPIMTLYFGRKYTEAKFNSEASK